MKHRILLKGPFLSLSGYGYQARFALQAIRSREDLFDIYLINTGWGQTSWITENSPERKYIEEKVFKTIHYIGSGGQFDINLQITIPNEVEQSAPINILYTAGIETTKVAPQWLEKVNLVNKVIVVSNHSKNIFKNTQYNINNQAGQHVGILSCQVPVDVVNYAFKKVEKGKLNINLDYDFNFLTMAQWGPRKDLEKVIEVFLNEFWEEEVGLVVKTSIANNSIIDRTNAEDRLEQMLEIARLGNQGDRKCKIYLLHGSLNDGELNALYAHENIRAFVTATHGEGFGLSIFESACNGLPVIAPGWSGQCDFLFKGNKELFTNVKYTLQRLQPEAVWPGVLEQDSSWAFVESSDLAFKMRKVMLEYENALAKANELKIHLEQEFAEEKKLGEFVESVLSVVPNTEISDDEIDEWLNNMNIDLVEVD